MKIFKVIGWGLLGALVLIQFVPASYPETADVNENDLIIAMDVEEDVGQLLRASCYDCHSNETHYPWYSYVAPAKWLVIRDVEQGRSNLNFSEWDTLKARDKVKLLDEMAEEVDDGTMPMPIYTFIHRGAALDESDKKMFTEWTEQAMNDLFGD
jgi:hypothetical protein